MFYKNLRAFSDTGVYLSVLGCYLRVEFFGIAKIYTSWGPRAPPPRVHLHGLISTSGVLAGVYQWQQGCLTWVSAPGKESWWRVGDPGQPKVGKLQAFFDFGK